MKTLILSCRTGQGHDSCAEAIRQYYEAQGEVCITADGLTFISERFSNFLSRGHVAMYRYFPWFFSCGYRYSEKHPRMFLEGAPVYRVLTSGTDRLHDYIASEGFEAVICTHVFTGIMMTALLKKYPMPLATAFVATDYTCSPGVRESCLDRYYIASETLADDYLCGSITKDKLRGVGIPLREDFYKNRDAARDRQDFGIGEGHTHLVVMCGSMGCGPIKNLASVLTHLLPDNVELSIVCGTNRRLEKHLRRRFEGSDRIHIHGYVHNVAGLMNSADLYLTKPGGISTTEAAMKNLPMVLIDTVSGCETYNLRYFVSCGGASTDSHLPSLTQLTLRLARSPETLAAMRRQLSSLPKDNAAALIYHDMKTLKESQAS